MIKFLLFFSFVSSISHARYDPELGPPPPPSFPSCNQDGLNSCRARELGARDDLHRQAYEIDKRLGPLASAVREAERIKNDSFAVVDGLAKEAFVLGEEISFLNRGAAPAAKEIFPGFASVEDLFRLTPGEKSWRESYPDQRAKTLNDRLAQVLAQKDPASRLLQENSTNFTSLTNQYQSLKAQRDALYSEAQAHETRSGTECQQLFCPGH